MCGCWQIIAVERSAQNLNQLAANAAQEVGSFAGAADRNRHAAPAGTERKPASAKATPPPIQMNRRDPRRRIAKGRLDFYPGRAFTLAN